MITYYKKEGKELTQLDGPETGCWINVTPPFKESELESFAGTYSIPLDFLTDSLDIDERSRYEREDDVKLILVNTPIRNEGGTENQAFYITHPIGIISTPDHIITVSSLNNMVIDKFLNGKIKNWQTNDDKGFVLKIFERTVLDYLNCLKKLNLKRNTIEIKLYDSSRNKELKELLAVEKSLVYFVNSLSANELLKMKMKRTDFLNIREDEEKTDLFEDIIIDNGQALEMANVYTNILNGTMEAYASIISNNLNVVIQRLTLTTIILMVPTLVASLYGMNVPLPFKNSPFAFYFIIIFSIAISLFLAWFFRRKRLL